MADEMARPTRDDDRAGWKVYWAEQGVPWRTEPEIGQERQRFLLERQKTKVSIEQGNFPFTGVPLNRADVEWLAATHGTTTPLDLRGANLQRADLSHLPLHNLRGCLDDLILVTLTPEQRAKGAINLDRANLDGAKLDGARLRDAKMQSASLVDTTLDRADLSIAHLENANLHGASLRGANLGGTYQAAGQPEEKQALYVAHLEDADLSGAHLEGANLRGARLEGAFMQGAHLEASDLTNAHLQGADLRRVVFSKGSTLDSIALSDRKHGPASLGDIQWNGVDLTVVDWHVLRRLGDEKPTPRGAKPLEIPATKPAWPSGSSSPVNDIKRASNDAFSLLLTSVFLLLGLFAVYHVLVSWWSPNHHLEAARANRRLAMALGEQGIIEADHFAYRAQVCQRKVLFRRLHGLRWLFSWLVDVLAGYGYKPLRTLFWYGVVVVGFGCVYYLLGPRVGVPFSPIGAVVFSLTSFHGRGFFPGGSPGHSISLDDPLTVLAACEAVFGLFIEASFIAAFTRRFFAR